MIKNSGKYGANEMGLKTAVPYRTLFEGKQVAGICVHGDGNQQQYGTSECFDCQQNKKYIYIS